MALRVLVVDDHPVVRKGLTAMLTAESWVSAVVEADTLAAARRAATTDRPDVAVVDLSLPDGDGITLVRELGTIAPRCAALIVTVTADAGTVRAALAAGARGYLLKDADPDLVVAAVRTVAAGGTVLGPQVGESTTVPPPFDMLTPRELRLALLVADGRTGRQIGAELGVSEKTVRNQTAAILAKVGAADRVRLALLAQRAGLSTIDPGPGGAP
ncbi:response regulator transcription factor [Paractinoplanes rishiriensis]|nr:response regulator transcription factor [Actinoplanes rishiriensis]